MHDATEPMTNDDPRLKAKGGVGGQDRTEKSRFEQRILCIRLRLTNLCGSRKRRTNHVTTMKISAFWAKRLPFFSLQRFNVFNGSTKPRVAAARTPPRIMKEKTRGRFVQCLFLFIIHKFPFFFG